MKIQSNKIYTDLQATGVKTTLARQRTMNMNDLVTKVVKNVHFKRTKIVAPISFAATAIFSSEKDFLSNRILYNVFIIGFVSSKHCM